jgi:hypothetical protein
MRKLNDFEKFFQERSKIQKLRNEGQSINKIAKQMNQSIGWVMQRLYESHKPKSIDRKRFFDAKTIIRGKVEYRTENEFIIYEIMPQLKASEFSYVGKSFYLMDWSKYDKYTDIRPEIDLVYEKENTTYIIEVKMKTSMNKIYQSIGQAIIMQYVHSEYNNMKYWIIFPKEIMEYKLFESEFLKWLKEKKNIEIHFF